MTDPQQSYELGIDVIFNALRILTAGKVDREFEAECQQRGYTLSVSQEVIQFAQLYLRKVPQIAIAGPRCSACPPPWE